MLTILYEPVHANVIAVAGGNADFALTAFAARPLRQSSIIIDAVADNSFPR